MINKQTRNAVFLVCYTANQQPLTPEVYSFVFMRKPPIEFFCNLLQMPPLIILRFLLFCSYELHSHLKTHEPCTSSREHAHTAPQFAWHGTADESKDIPLVRSIAMVWRTQQRTVRSCYQQAVITKRMIDWHKLTKISTPVLLICIDQSIKWWASIHWRTLVYSIT